MKAAVLYAKHQPLRVEEVDLDPPRAREVLVKMAASGVCHSDLHYIKGDREHPMPVVLGHERKESRVSHFEPTRGPVLSS